MIPACSQDRTFYLRDLRSFQTGTIPGRRRTRVSSLQRAPLSSIQTPLDNLSPGILATLPLPAARLQEVSFPPSIRLAPSLLRVLVTQSCLTLYDLMDCSPPGSSVHGILQAKILEWVAMSSSKASSRPWDRTRVSYICCIGRQVLYTSVTWEAHFSTGDDCKACSSTYTRSLKDKISPLFADSTPSGLCPFPLPAVPDSWRFHRGHAASVQGAELQCDPSRDLHPPTPPPPAAESLLKHKLESRLLGEKSIA